MDTSSLMKQILSSDNLNRAYLQVVRNKGAEGVDGMKYTELKEHLVKDGEIIKEQLRTRKYKPQLKKYGIASEDSLVTTSKGNFYPLLRQKIIKSWDRIFTIQPDDPSLMVGTCWKLKKEWIREVRFYDGE